jgi:hypothetical protein
MTKIFEYIYIYIYKVTSKWDSEDTTPIRRKHHLFIGRHVIGLRLNSNRFASYSSPASYSRDFTESPIDFFMDGGKQAIQWGSTVHFMGLGNLHPAPSCYTKLSEAK